MGCLGSKKTQDGSDGGNVVVSSQNRKSLAEKIEQGGIKVVLVGDAFTGKTSILNRLVYNQFANALPSTVGASFLTHKCQVGSRIVRMDIWDTAGSERYRAMAPMYYRQAAAALVVYDITQHATFEITEQWIDELVEREPEVIVAVVGNKCDLEESRAVTTTEAERFVQGLKSKNTAAFHMECSAKSGQNVENIFKEILMNTVSRKLTNRIRESSEWIERMSDMMTDIQTSMGLVFRLQWTAKKEMAEGELSVRNSINCLQAINI